MEAGNLRPVAVVTTEVEHRGRAPTRVVIDEAWGQVVEWGETMHGEGTALGTGTWSPKIDRWQFFWHGGQTARDEAAQGQERVRRDASDCIHHDNKHVDIRQ